MRVIRERAVVAGAAAVLLATLMAAPHLIRTDQDPRASRKTAPALAGSAVAPEEATSSPADKPSQGPSDRVKGNRPRNALAGKQGEMGRVVCDGPNQLEGSVYAAPCTPAFKGSNGGATYRGVDSHTLRFALRINADSPDPSLDGDSWKIMRDLVDYLNPRYELYGRKLVIEPWRGSGRSLDELQDQGSAEACHDAKRLKEEGYFGVLYQSGARHGRPTFPSGVFTECAAKERLFLPLGPQSYPDRHYNRWHPYVWQLHPSCDQMVLSMAAYVGKRLPGTATWAKSPSLRGERVYGMYIPQNEAYDMCGDRLETLLRDAYGVNIKLRISYELNLADLARQAATAAPRFKDAGVTSLIVASDITSFRLMTDSAQAYDWGPEWLVVGADCQDCDSGGRGLNQDRVDGHAFGQSAIDDRVRSFSSDSEVAAVAHALGWKVNGAFTFYYAELMDVFNKVHVAGPDLTPANVASGLRAMAVRGSPDSIWGTWSYAQGHTGIQDFREIYWRKDVRSPDGEPGTWLRTYNGRRFTASTWPSGSPPIYP